LATGTFAVRRRLVGATLRWHRAALGYTLDDAARVLDCGPSKISRIETGKRGIRGGELCELLAKYGVDAKVRDVLALIADPRDTADSVAFALLFSGKKRVQDSDRFMASIVAQRIVAHLERCGYVILKKPPIGGSDPLNKPPGWPHTSREKPEMSG